MIKYQLFLLEFILFFALRADDWPNGPSPSLTYLVTSTRNGWIETGDDEDWFQQTLKANFYYRVWVQAPTSPSTLIPQATVRGPAPSQTVVSIGSYTPLAARPNSMIVFKAPAAGTYYIIASSNSQTIGAFHIWMFETPCFDNCGNIYFSLEMF